MASYRTILQSEIDPAAPGTATLFFALANNPEGIAEGVGGAPRIKDAALDAGAATAAGTTWVEKRMAGITAGNVGTMAMAVYTSSGTIQFGSTVDGAVLTPSGAGGNTGTTANLGSGTTWRCLGVAAVGGSGDPHSATLWVRVS